MNTEPEKRKYPRSEALAIAEQIKADLAPFCERIAIAGSLRRMLALVGDVELLYIPRMEDRKADFFSTKPFDLAGEKIGHWLADETLAKRPKIDGTFTWGAKNKLASHVATGIPVDFFATTAENWWVSLVIRTGGKETNLKLTTGAQAKGMRLNAYGSGFTLQNQQQLQCGSEREVFEIAGVPYAEPECRV